MRHYRLKIVDLKKFKNSIIKMHKAKIRYLYPQTQDIQIDQA